MYGLLNKTVSVYRKTIEGYNDFNEKIYGSTLIATNLAVALQDVRYDEYPFVEPGSIVKKRREMFCIVADTTFLEGDTVVASDGTYKMISVMKPDGREHHMEILIERMDEE